MDLAQVRSRIFVGSHPRDTHDIKTLKEQFGITAILCLQTDDDFDYLGIDPWAIEAAASANDIVYRRVPVRDFDAEDLKRNLPQCVEVLQELLNEGHTVYVHCTAGQGRSPSVVVAYLHWVEGWPLREAAGLVTGVRWCSPNLQAIREVDFQATAAKARQTPPKSDQQ